MILDPGDPFWRVNWQRWQAHFKKLGRDGERRKITIISDDGRRRDKDSGTKHPDDRGRPTTFKAFYGDDFVLAVDVPDDPPPVCFGILGPNAGLVQGKSNDDLISNHDLTIMRWKTPWKITHDWFPNMHSVASRRVQWPAYRRIPDFPTSAVIDNDPTDHGAFDPVKPVFRPVYKKESDRELDAQIPTICAALERRWGWPPLGSFWILMKRPFPCGDPRARTNISPKSFKRFAPIPAPLGAAPAIHPPTPDRDSARTTVLVFRVLGVIASLYHVAPGFNCGPILAVALG